MTLDASLDAALAEPTADAGAQETATAAETPAVTQPVAQPERTYTKADLEAEINKAVQSRLSRRSLEEHFRSQGWVHPSEAQKLRQPEAPKPEADPNQKWLEQVIEAKMQERLAPIQAKEVERDLDAAIGRLTSTYAELSNEEKLREVLDTVIELGLDKATHLTVEQALEVAYRYARQFPDLDAIKRQAADEAIKSYTTKKVETASKTPKSEGAGGSGAVTPAKKITKREEYADAIEAALARID